MIAPFDSKEECTMGDFFAVPENGDAANVVAAIVVLFLMAVGVI